LPNDSSGNRIWAVFRLYHPNFAGGAIQANPILKNLAKFGYEVTVLAAADRLAATLGGQQVVVDELLVCYVPMLRLRAWERFLKVPKLRKALQYLNNLLSELTFNLNLALIILRKGKPDDILQLYSINRFAFIVEWSARVRKMHVVVQLTLLGADDPSSFTRMPDRVLKMQALRGANRIVAISNALAESCYGSNLARERVDIIPNGVNVERYSPIAQDGKEELRVGLGFPPDCKCILFVGSAKYRKGIDVLIRSYIELSGEHLDTELVVIGPYDFSDRDRYDPSDQHLIDTLKDELMEAGVSSRVHWLGLIQENLEEYFQAADVFCFPTRREGLPNVVTMALAAGLPIVASRLEGVTTDQVEDGKEGFLVSSYDPLAYAQALCRLLRDSTLRSEMGKEARKKAVSKFDLDLIARRYVQLYEKMSNSEPRHLDNE